MAVVGRVGIRAPYAVRPIHPHITWNTKKTGYCEKNTEFSVVCINEEDISFPVTGAIRFFFVANSNSLAQIVFAKAGINNKLYGLDSYCFWWERSYNDLSSIVNF